MSAVIKMETGRSSHYHQHRVFFLVQLTKSTPGFTTPAIKFNTTPRFTSTPTPLILRSTPRFTPTPTPSIIRSTTTTTALPSTTTPSTANFYVSTSTPSSYSYAYQHDAKPVSVIPFTVASIETRGLGNLHYKPGISN